ncbi:STAS domain-containing protein [Synechocystis sp. LKSZ1]|uniref:STAS domain-containing protein n=1 Tax=Synechocystis sp. LKSZ1 TaxID=3144951 RepID=UPI00336BEF8F
MNLNLPAIHPTMLDVSGAITVENAPAVEALLTEVIQTLPHDHVVLNMQKVDFLDSTGLVVLVSAWRLAQDLGKQLSLSALTPGVRLIFDLTQLDRVFHLIEESAQFTF